MPQIAQQDYIRIPIADLTEMTDSEKAEIKKAIDNNTIFDCIIQTEHGESRILAVSIMSKRFHLIDPEDGSLIFCIYDE